MPRVRSLKFPAVKRLSFEEIVSAIVLFIVDGPLPPEALAEANVIGV
jgi:hypothetical protein